MGKQDLSQIELTKIKGRLLLYLLLVLGLMIIALYFYYQNTRLDSLNEQHVQKLAQNKIRSAQTIDSLADVLEYERMKSDSLLTLQTSQNWKEIKDILIKPPNTEKREIESIKNSKYLIALHSFAVNESENKEIIALLKNQGFEVKEDYITYRDKPSWLSNEPVVFYYSNESKVKAEKLAEDISAGTGKKFTAKIGSGYGVIKGLEKFTFFVHNVPI